MIIILSKKKLAIEFEEYWHTNWNADKDKTFLVPIKKQVKRIDKNAKKTLEKPYLTDYNLLTVQDL